ncbi:FAM10 family protein At4g22670-like [Phragmites australis]|uniref:FAM10 family protein At4g22670-like n=1 Tax=Phragmites australis TaxID=29695 RepID=UPI002D76C38D|nr:FAM10 family protein At4g22670-like [Phragmites australis]
MASKSELKTEDISADEMGGCSVEVTEENRDASQEAKGKAMEATSKGKLEYAVEHLTKAILLDPFSAIMYGTRASVFIKMKKPLPAIRDANAALEINPDSAKGYKIELVERLMPMLGKWEEAARDLHTAPNTGLVYKKLETRSVARTPFLSSLARLRHSALPHETGYQT